MLDDGQSQAGAADLLGVALVHPVKPLEHPLLMLRADADAGVRHRENSLIFFLPEPHDDQPAVFVVLDSVVHEVEHNPGNQLRNPLENLPGSLQAEKNSLEETKGQLENARAELDTPFAREEELAEKTARLKELNILLKVDEKDKTLIDSVPDEGEEAPQRKVMGLER